MRTDHSRIWLMTLLLGAALSWPLPLGGILLAVAASFGLVISWEAGMSQGEMTPVPVAPAVPASLTEEPRPSER